MRIAIICPYYPFPPSVGGVETIVRQAATELVKRGYEVHIVTTPFDVTTGKQVSNYGTEERSGITVHKLEPRFIKIGYARVMKGLKDTLHSIKPDIVHCHNLHPHLLQINKWKKYFRYKLVSELHHPAATVNKVVQKILLPIAFYYVKMNQENIDAFIAHTELERKWLISRGIREESIYKIFFPAIPQELLRYKPRRHYNTDIIFVGRIVQEKGVHVLIKALSIIVREINDVKLWVIGPADYKYFKKILRLTRKLGLEKNVEFKGPMYSYEKLDAIASAKILVLPSLKEYTPNVVLEAQALGVPVVATAVGAIHDLVINGRTGILVRRNNAKDLADAICMLLKEDRLRKIMSVKAKENAMMYTLTHSVSMLELLYHELSLH